MATCRYRCTLCRAAENTLGLTNAPPMTPAIAATLRTSANFTTDREVSLFSSLARSITEHSSSAFIDETHGGGVCNVSFSSVSKKVETCEIADLLIISISNQNDLRATFWQAKKEAKSKWVSRSTGSEQFDFDGQLNQWDLLSRRPLVTGVASFHPPRDLLSSFSSAAIGSFGVFYQRGSLLQVSHSTAEFVACLNPTVKSPKMGVNGYLTRFRCGESEILVRTTLEAFLDSLLAWEIGAVLNRAHPTHRWLIEYARRKSSGQQVPTEIIRVLDGFKGDFPSPDNVLVHPGDGLSILIVRASGA
jgi:hypothetical protein